MSESHFSHVRIAGVKSVLPQHFIDIDDELEFFERCRNSISVLPIRLQALVLFLFFCSRLFCLGKV